VSDCREIVTELLYKDGMLLDQRRWDEWLQLYAPDVTYWVPSWETETELTSDPDTELSLIYYDSRAGLEDRVFRIGTQRSAATNPFPRTCHLVSNVLILDDRGTACDARASWQVHVYDFKDSHTYYGFYDVSFEAGSDGWQFKRKKITLLNDNMPGPLDIYCL
jgi:3-phenylpropionate/cinnamic acid dioxygenase small subunit